MDHGPFSARNLGAKINVRLTKSAYGGLGIKIAERDNMIGANRPIYITAICPDGSAKKDGRLKEGDALLEVNGIDLTGKSQPEVTKLLKSIAVNQTVELVVSRPHSALTSEHNNSRYINHSNSNSNSNNSSSNSTDNTTTQSIITQESSQDTEIKQPLTDPDSEINLSLIDLNPPDPEPTKDGGNVDQSALQQNNTVAVDGPGTYEYDVPLNDTKSAGLGLYLKFPGREDKDRGIFVERVMVGGAAWKDGRLQSDDQLLAINGINLMGLSNSKAFETLRAAVCRATTNTIRLKIIRRDPSVVATLLHGAYNTIESADLKAISQQTAEPAPSVQSCDDESLDGEDRFKRDNFARQSVSEKRHLQLMARSSDKGAHKKSNSLESIKTQDRAQNTIVIPPRAGTLRVTRNRKVNESFRAAVDRSYENSIQNGVGPEYQNLDYSASNERSVDVSNYNYSMGYSTTSTNNDEKVLLRNTNDNLTVRNSDGNNNHHKIILSNHINNHNASNSITNLDNNHHGSSTTPIAQTNNNAINNVEFKEKKSSLLSKFFGSMKKLKKKNKDDDSTKTNPKAVANNRDPELSRSQSSKSSNLRYQVQQNHPGSVPPNHQYQHQRHQMTPNGSSNYNQSLKPVQLTNRTSLPVNHHQYHNLSQHNQQPPMTYSKVAYHMMPDARPFMNGHHYSNSYMQQIVQPMHHQIPVDLHHQHMTPTYQTSPRVMPSHALNGTHHYSQWQSTPPQQTMGLPVSDGLWVTNSADDNLRLRNIYGTHTQNVPHMHNPRMAPMVQHHPSPFVPTINGHVDTQVPNKMIHHIPGQTATLPHANHQNMHPPNQPPPRIIYYDF